MSEEKWWINKFNSFLKKSKGDKAKAIAKIQDYIEKKDDYYKRLRKLRAGTLERTEFEYLPDYVESLEDKQAREDRMEEVKNKRTMSDEDLWKVLGLGD